MNDWQDAEQRAERAQEYFAQRKWHEALKELRAAIAINPDNPAWLFDLGLTLDEMERYDEAIDAYRQSLALHPDDLDAMNHLAIDLHQVGRSQEALELFGQVEALDATFEPCYCNRITVYTDLGNHEKAEEVFYLARLHREHCPDCYYNLGCSLAQRHLYDKAIYCWQKVLDLDEPNPQVHLRIAEALWSKGQLEQSRQHYLTALRLDPGNVEILLDLGDLLMEMGRLEDAGQRYHRAVEQSPDSASAHFCLARWLMAGHGDQDAIQAFERALELDPTYPGAHLHLGQIHLRMGERHQARRHLRAELRLRGDDPQILLDLSNLLIDTAQIRAAVACLHRLVTLQPTHAAAWQNLAVAQFLFGAYNEGITSSQKSLEHDPANTSALYNLATACEHLRRYEDGLRWITRALHHAPDDLALQRLRVRLRILKFASRALQLVRRVLPLRTSARS